MAQSRSPAGSGVNSGVGSERINDSDQYPTAMVFDEVPGRSNRLDNVDEFSFAIATDSTGELATYVALDNGRVTGITVRNGGTDADGSNGWEIDILDSDQSDAELGHFGLGSNTNAASANDNKDIDADTTAYISNSLGAAGANRFSKGDVITVDVTEDGTAGAADVVVHLQYESAGHV